ncbi:hypothetical protein EGW08_012243 [Elysia chlorotica]|uniref:FKRP stem domain-containing protein n=1 Tax=Elysia chlorotica TaxID=188477 RepID=A0A3S1BG30_ELYCH|nr:hypothetical protein EGW08_012243 [Elysia chlorotica]
MYPPVEIDPDSNVRIINLEADLTRNYSSGDVSHLIRTEFVLILPDASSLESANQIKSFIAFLNFKKATKAVAIPQVDESLYCTNFSVDLKRWVMKKKAAVFCSYAEVEYKALEVRSQRKKLLSWLAKTGALEQLQCVFHGLQTVITQWTKWIGLWSLQMSGITFTVEQGSISDDSMVKSGWLRAISILKAPSCSSLLGVPFMFCLYCGLYWPEVTANVGITCTMLQGSIVDETIISIGLMIHRCMDKQYILVCEGVHQDPFLGFRKTCFPPLGRETDKVFGEGNPEGVVMQQSDYHRGDHGVLLAGAQSATHDLAVRAPRQHDVNVELA